MKIKSGDMIVVITGKDKGKTGKVLRAFPRDMKVLVEGINMKKKHQRSNKQDGKGQIIDKPHPLDVSNVRKSDSAPAAKPKAKPAKAEKEKTEKKPAAKKTSKKSE